MTYIISLIILGLLLMLVELLLVPGVGVAGFASLASLAAACWYAFAKISVRAGWITVAVVIFILLLFLVWILRAKTWKRFEQKSVIDARTNVEVESVKVGDRGVTTTRLAPMGMARIGGVQLEVKSCDNSLVDPSSEIEVVAIENNTVSVKTI